MENIERLFGFDGPRHLWRAAALWYRRAVTRRALRRLDARGLADIGIDEAGRRAECAKYFWQA